MRSFPQFFLALFWRISANGEIGRAFSRTSGWKSAVPEPEKNRFHPRGINIIIIAQNSQTELTEHHPEHHLDSDRRLIRSEMMSTRRRSSTGCSNANINCSCQLVSTSKHKLAGWWQGRLRSSVEFLARYGRHRQTSAGLIFTSIDLLDVYFDRLGATVALWMLAGPFTLVLAIALRQAPRTTVFAVQLASYRRPHWPLLPRA